MFIKSRTSVSQTPKLVLDLAPGGEMNLPDSEPAAVFCWGCGSKSLRVRPRVCSRPWLKEKTTVGASDVGTGRRDMAKGRCRGLMGTPLGSG